VIRILNFFYSAVKARQARNQISHLINDKGEVLSKLSIIKDLASSFYEKLFHQASYWNVFLEVIVKKKLTSEAASWLSRDVSDVEIKTVHPNKATCPDGYDACFFQKNWKIIGGNLCKIAVQSFRKAFLH